MKAVCKQVDTQWLKGLKLRKIFSLLADGTQIITANQRLSLSLQRTLEKHFATQHTRWRTPVFMPLSVWLTTLYTQLNDAVILTSLQAQSLWADIIQSSEDTPTQFPVQQCAELAESAWQTLHLWKVAYEDVDPEGNEEVAFFLDWAAQYAARCEEANWISSACVPARLTEQADRLELGTNRIALVGFDALPPAILSLLDALPCAHEIVDLALPDPASAYQIALDDTDTEIKTMALWAKAWQAKSPGASIACIVPNLATCRLHVERILTETFGTQDAFNLSAAQPLGAYPLIYHALCALAFSLDTVDLATFHSVVQSPYLAQHADDPLIGAVVDARARTQNESTRDLESMLPLFTDAHPTFTHSTWLARWRALMGWQKALPQKATPVEWVQQFTAGLAALGWPGHRAITSVEYQLITRWKKLLHEFTQIEIVHPVLSRSAALTQLSRLAQNTPFQAEGSEAPIQVLGLLESGGNLFDAIWVMGLHDEAWPPPAQPNPFLPYRLQTTHNMPHASAARELAYTERVMQRLLHSAQTIIFSAPLQDHDKIRSPSQLIQAFAPYPESIPTPTSPFDAALSKPLTPYTDFHAPAVTRAEHIEGGSWILTLQAACPFRAFASIRLHAQRIETPTLGIPATTRGSLLHDALERLWLALKSHRTLSQLSDASQAERIDSTLGRVFDAAIKPYHSPGTRYFYHLEKKRLAQLLADWLDFEKQRPPFIVSEHESIKHIQLGDLKLMVKIDRIDTLENGQRIIIDYKSTADSPASWFGPRPKAPQLPLYCCLADPHKPYDGITFAQVQPNRLTFRGIWADNAADQLNGFGAIKTPAQSKDTPETTWAALTTSWQQTLETLAQDFCAGKADVDPLDATTCTFCDCAPLCRIRALCHE